VEQHPFDGVGRVSASFGIALWQGEADARDLIKRVDEALYQAKEQGRNRVVSAD